MKNKMIRAGLGVVIGATILMVCFLVGVGFYELLNMVAR